ncbi:hypothetical protein SAMD00023353_4000690 [Rosellinia necatrix]|uniref:Uncharacterized protein n=1 Tax=Rosellinia necatrix TaxID=77044 RepID=A0A1W2TM68_ROSNE|nr:hypothetical protein SAMD00023353_4000690 [Rosellinia necatrix]
MRAQGGRPARNEAAEPHGIPLAGLMNWPHEAKENDGQTVRTVLLLSSTGLRVAKPRQCGTVAQEG